MTEMPKAGSPGPRPARARLRAAAIGIVAAFAIGVAVEVWIRRQPVTIQMEDTPLGGIYEPDSVTVSVGTTVRWRNDGQAVHDATDRLDATTHTEHVGYPAGAQPFDSGSLAPGQTFSHTFTVPGTYKYICIPHEMGGMTGEVIVTK